MSEYNKPIAVNNSSDLPPSVSDRLKAVFGIDGIKKSITDNFSTLNTSLQSYQSETNSAITAIVTTQKLDKKTLTELVANNKTIDGEVKIFTTLALAKDWESKNPGLVALTIEDTSPDLVPPSNPGILGVKMFRNSAKLSVTGAEDDRRQLRYRFAYNGGSWSPWVDKPEYTITGLAALTSYVFKHEVMDNGENTVAGLPVSGTTNNLSQIDYSNFREIVKTSKPLLHYTLVNSARSESTVVTTTPVITETNVTYTPTGARFAGNGKLSIKQETGLPQDWGTGSLEFIVTNEGVFKSASLYVSTGTMAVSSWFADLQGRATVNFNDNVMVTPITESQYNRPMYYVLTYDKSNFCFYENGSLIGKKAVTGPFYVGSKPDVQIGMDRDRTATALTGIVSDVAVYNKALTEYDILNRARSLGY